MSYTVNRHVDGFFLRAIDQIFIQKQKQIFLMDGPIGLGKTSNFLVMGAYLVACHVEPVKRQNKMVRESLWAIIREAESAAFATLYYTLRETLFTPEILEHPQSPVSIKGNHPVIVTINHALEDGTWLYMKIECHGFNNEQSQTRLLSRNFLGTLIPECQSVPWQIVETARQRSGRQTGVMIKRRINGKVYTLSGAQATRIVLADANIPHRPHAMYTEIYDKPQTVDSPILLLTPPPPILPIPVDMATETLLSSKRYPITLFKKKKRIWLPNPACYYMQTHFEEKITDDEGNTLKTEQGNDLSIPYSGYSLWYNELHRSDSIITRLVLGRPDKQGSGIAVYHNFDIDLYIKMKEPPKNKQLYVGVDPGLIAAYIFFEYDEQANSIHVFDEIIFEKASGHLSRAQIDLFVAPRLRELEQEGNIVTIIPDPYAWVSTNQGEGLAYLLRNEGFNVLPCLSANNEVTERINCLAYYIDKGLITVDPRCQMVKGGLSGGYCFMTDRSGKSTGKIDKTNPYTDTIEALQYPVVNLYRKFIYPLLMRDRHAKTKSSSLHGVYAAKVK